MTETVETLLQRAVEAERQALEFRHLGDNVSAYAFAQMAYGWLEEALEKEKTNAPL